MDEKKARKLYCPLDTNSESPGNCVGNSCMWWIIWKDDGGNCAMNFICGALLDISRKKS